jgi:EAL domain-containing protein (putative c-di-GMP-specific phosphodiesterase class I)
MPFHIPARAHAVRRGSSARAQIRRALANSELRLLYHPIVSMTTGRMQGVEALLRWEHPDAGLLAPHEFLPAVEDTPLMPEVTRWVLLTALRAARQLPMLSVSVNLSFRDVTRPELVQDVDEALDVSGSSGTRLTLELTEQALVQNLPDAVSVLRELRARGVALALDDFGTGASPLLYLRDLPLTHLKIDRTFVSGVLTSDEDLAIVTSVAKLGRFLGIEVVAEGVETIEQARVVHAAGCTAGQGYLWGLPRPVTEIDPRAVTELPKGTPRAQDPASYPTSRASYRIRELATQGASLHTIAAALNKEGMRTPQLTRWTASRVAHVLRDVEDPARAGGSGSDPSQD